MSDTLKQVVPNIIKQVMYSILKQVMCSILKQVMHNILKQVMRNILIQVLHNNVKQYPVNIQQDATLHSLFISVNCSTCFGWYLHPSSGAHTTVSAASGTCTSTRCCR